MSAALLKKSLEIVDREFTTKGPKKKNKGVLDLVPVKFKLKSQEQSSNPTKKYTIIEAKKQISSKEDKIKENLRKLEVLRNSTKIQLDKDITKTIIERAVTRRPVRSKKQSQKVKKTAFTEEDFKKFEEEYMNE